LPDTQSPLLLGGNVNGSILTLTYNEALDITHQPNLAAFTVVVNGLPRQVLSVAESGGAAALTLSAPVSSSDLVKVSYSDISAGNDAFALQDLSGNDAIGFVNQTVINSTGGASSTSPVIVAASFSEPVLGTSVLSLVFNQPMQLPQAGAGAMPVFLKNGTTAINILGSPSVAGSTITLTTDTVLSATDYVLVEDDGYGYWRNTAGAGMWGGSIVIGGSGVSEPHLENLSGLYNTLVMGNGGNDVLGGNWGARLIGGAGSDTLLAASGSSQIYVADGATPVSDIIVFDDDYHKSRPGFFTTVYGFDTTAATTNDQLSVLSDIIAANSGLVNGIDTGGIRSHSISGGIVSFYSDDAGNIPVAVGEATLMAAAAYLDSNITAAGTNVAFYVDADGNGAADSLAVFEQTGHHSLYDQSFFLLSGVVGATLGTGAAQNVVQLIDGAPPNLCWAELTPNGVTFSFTEPVVSPTSALPGTTYQLGHGGALAPMTLTGAIVSGNSLTITSSSVLQPGDYVLMSVDRGQNAVPGITDLHGNLMLPYDIDALAIAGENSVVDLSRIDGTTAIFALAGGNNVLIGGAGSNNIIAGGGDNLLVGNAGDDDLRGAAGNERIFAGEGDDRLSGRAGADFLDGGAGADEFNF
jgi:uncharacterized repeat protein (TIGR02059 family)